MFGDPYFSFQKQILFTIISTLSKNEQKKQCGKLKFQDLCPRDMESCYLEAARRMKLWSLNANLFFKEPQQLTKFTWWVHLKFGREYFTSKDVIAIFLGLQTSWPYSLKKPVFFFFFFRFRVFFRANSLQNEVCDPPFFFPLWHHQLIIFQW